MTDTDLATHVRAEIRVHLARIDMTRSQLAEAIGVSPDWMMRRLAGTVGMSLHDVEVIAHGLGVPVTDLLPRSLPGI